jgi:hypothetical protein
VLEYHPAEEPVNTYIALVISYDPRPPVTGSAAYWHAALGHPGPEAIAHLEGAVNGVTVDGKALTTAQCETCALLKAREIVSRRSDKEDPAAEPLARVMYDLIPFLPAYNGDQWVSHFICCYTTIDFVYCYSCKYQALDTITEFLNIVKTRYSRIIKYFRTDSERTLG